MADRERDMEAPPRLGAGLGLKSCAAIETQTDMGQRERELDDTTERSTRWEEEGKNPEHIERRERERERQKACRTTSRIRLAFLHPRSHSLFHSILQITSTFAMIGPDTPEFAFPKKRFSLASAFHLGMFPEKK
jgi:hypothetical protein